MSESASNDSPTPEDRPIPPDDAPERPDWLVGAEEGAQAEQSRSGEPSPHLRLVRPGADGAPAGGDGKPAAPAKPKPWAAAASSVPRLQRVEAAPAEPAKPPASRGQAAESAFGRTPPARTAAEPLWAEPDAPSALDDFPHDAHAAQADADDPLAVPGGAAPRAVRPAPPAEPWWAIALDMVQTNRTLQLGVLAALLAVLAFMLWPRSEPTVSIRSIHEHPERYDGTVVRVSGKVGDVYEIGGAYAFYLENGRDTIVVFSRVRRPYRNEKLQVAGSVSMGYLDGIARPSLFEQPH